MRGTSPGNTYEWGNASLFCVSLHAPFVIVQQYCSSDYNEFPGICHHNRYSVVGKERMSYHIQDGHILLASGQLAGQPCVSPMAR